MSRLLPLTFGALAALMLAAGPVHADEAAARETYKKHCQICHGKDGSGKTKEGEKSKTADWRDGSIWKKVDDATSKKIILDGKEKMKAYRDKVSEDQLDDLLAFCKTLAAAAEAK